MHDYDLKSAYVQLPTAARGVRSRNGKNSAVNSGNVFTFRALVALDWLVVKDASGISESAGS